MVGWHHRLNGHEFGQTLGDGEGQGSLVCCSPRGHKESDLTQCLHNNKILTIQSSAWEVIMQSYIKGSEKFCNKDFMLCLPNMGDHENSFFLPSSFQPPSSLPIQFTCFLKSICFGTAALNGTQNSHSFHEEKKFQ